MFGCLVLSALVVGASVWTNVVTSPGSGSFRECGTPDGSPLADLAAHQVDTLATADARRVKGDVICDDPPSNRIVYAHSGSWREARTLYESAAQRNDWVVLRRDDQLCMFRDFGDQTAVTRLNWSERPRRDGIFLHGDTLIVLRGEAGFVCSDRDHPRGRAGQCQLCLALVAPAVRAADREQGDSPTSKAAASAEDQHVGVGG